MCNARDKVIKAFKDGVFSFKYGFRKKKSSDETKLDLKELKLDNIPEWTEASKEHLKKVIKDVPDNLDNKAHVASVKSIKYHSKNAEKLLLDAFTKDIDKYVTKKLYKKLIERSIITLSRVPCKGKEKRENITDVLSNLSYF